MIEIDADDEDPTEAVIVVNNAGTEQDNRLVDVTFVVDGDVLLVSFHVLAKPREKAKVTNRSFMVAWGDLDEYLEYESYYTTRMPRACTVGSAAKQKWTLYVD